MAQDAGTRPKYAPVEGTMPLPIGSLVALATPMTDDGKAPPGEWATHSI